MGESSVFFFGEVLFCVAQLLSLCPLRVRLIWAEDYFIIIRWGDWFYVCAPYGKSSSNKQLIRAPAWLVEQSGTSEPLSKYIFNFYFSSAFALALARLCLAMQYA